MNLSFMNMIGWAIAIPMLPFYGFAMLMIFLLGLFLLGSTVLYAYVWNSQESCRYSSSSVPTAVAYFCFAVMVVVLMGLILVTGIISGIVLAVALLIASVIRYFTNNALSLSGAMRMA